MDVNMDRFKDFFKQDRLAAMLGIELVEAEPGRAIVRMTLRPEHHNALGIAHGGTIFSLADFAFAVASNACGTAAVAINVTISYMKAVSEGVLTARAEEVGAGKRLGTYLVRVTDDQGCLVALFQGTAFRKGDPLPFGV
jgi:acyl-CoA thioesterase